MQPSLEPMQRDAAVMSNGNEGAVIHPGNVEALITMSAHPRNGLKGTTSACAHDKMYHMISGIGGQGGATRLSTSTKQTHPSSWALQGGGERA